MNLVYVTLGGTFRISKLSVFRQFVFDIKQSLCIKRDEHGLVIENQGLNI